VIIIEVFFAIRSGFAAEKGRKMRPKINNNNEKIFIKEMRVFFS